MRHFALLICAAIGGLPGFEMFGAGRGSSCFGADAAAAEAYDPLKLPDGTEVRTIDLSVRDDVRRREIPIRVYLSSETEPGPVVLFSHGLGGTCKGSAYLGRHWAGRRYAAVFLQHPGSDDSVWKDLPVLQRLAAMKAAASGKNFVLRVRDVSAVIDRLSRWNESKKHPLFRRLDLQQIGMSGHSFGAATTQAVSGQAFARRTWFTDPRIKAAVIMSPTYPRRGDPATAFGSVKIPWLIMTGTHDTSLIGGTDVASRLKVFPKLPPGDKYELVLDGAEHSAFSDRRLPGERLPRNPNHHRVILALSTAFWDAYLRHEAAARDWLQGDGPKSVLQPKDRWQRK